MKMKMTSLDRDYKVLADRIVLFPGAVRNSKVVTDLADLAGWEPNLYDGYPDGLPRRFETEVTISNEIPGGAEVLLDLAGSLNSYASIINSNIESNNYDLGSSWHAHVSKYSEGGRTGVHSDEGYTEDNGIYTVIVYLNDEYQYGEVAFVDHDIMVKPSTGDVLIFPSYYRHYSEPVVSGYKYISIFRLKY